MGKHSTLTFVGLALSMLGLSHHVFADVAPDPGYKRISLKLIVATNDDLPDYRFFIRSGADLREVFVRKGEQTVIEPLGGGAYYSTGRLIAVPRKSLSGLSEAPTDGKLSELQKAVYDGKAASMIELVNHSFAREVRESDASSATDPVYRIDPDPQAGLRAVHVSGGANVSAGESNVSSGLRFWGSAGAAIVAGIFLLFGVAMLGIMYFRRSSKVL